MKKQSFLPLASVILLLSVFIFSCKSADKKVAEEKFEFNLEPGKSYEYTTKVDMKQEAMGQSTDISIGGRYIVNVESADTASSKLSITYQQFSMHIDANGMKIDIDTDKPAPQANGDGQMDPAGFMVKMFSGIKGKKFAMTVGKKGDILAVSGFNSIINAMLDSMLLDDQQKMEAKMSLSDQFSDASAREQFSQMFHFFPNYLAQAGGLKPGSKWNVYSQRGGARMPMRYNTNYTISKIDTDRVFLNAASDITSEEAAITGKDTGTLEVDRSSGLLIKADFVQMVELTAETGKIIMNSKTVMTGKEL